jgi:hypothetical protein
LYIPKLHIPFLISFPFSLVKGQPVGPIQQGRR